MPGELPPSALDDAEKDKLVANLLGARRTGRPPFLVRTLRYIKEHRHELQKSMWEVEWASSRTAARANRKLTLKCTPTKCTLPDVAVRRFHSKPSAAAAATPAIDAPQFGKGRVRIWLQAETVLGESMAFSVKECPVRVWPRSHVTGGAPCVDLDAAQAFDISAVMSFLQHRAARLEIVFELYPKKVGLAGAECAVFRGVAVLMDKHASPSSSVLNKEYHVVLKPVDKDARRLEPGMGLTVGHGQQNEGGDNQGDTVMVPVDDDAPIVLPDELLLENVDAAHGMVTLELFANFDNVVEQQAAMPHKEILIECVYKSPAFPWWNGIVRHDFICPWCHRNCRRLRTLLLHFHLDHDHSELTLHSTRKDVSPVNAEAPFVLNLSVTPVQPVPTADPAPPPVGAEDVNARKDKYPALAQSVCTPCPQPNGRAPDGVVDDDMLTEEDEDPVELRNLVNCKTCGRKHYGRYVGDKRYCSEICEAQGLHQEQEPRAEGEARADGSSVDDLPLSKLSKLSLTRRPRIDFKKALGDKTLYHVVSLVPFKASHFDEDGADSEDEVDQTWRLQIIEDKLAALKGPCARSRVLWTMWNRYAHENYPAPGAYAERYTRYSVECFVLEYASEIKRLKLRLYLCAFLRVLHIHGCIDSEAWLSVMFCLDGKKKRRDIAISARPESNPVIDPKNRKNRRRR